MTDIKRRDTTFDIAKGIAIILMCVGHTNCPDNLNEFIYMFHMAFFFMASGWFFNDKNFDNFPLYLWKRIKGLWLPFMVWGSAFVLLHNFFLSVGLLSAGNVEYTIKDILWKTFTTIPRFIPTEDMMGPYWFLSCLFRVSICVWLVMWMCSKFPKRKICAAVIFGILYLTAWLDIWYNIGLGDTVVMTFCVSAIFFIAMILNQGGYLRIIKAQPYICILISLTTLLVGMYAGVGHISTPELEFQNPLLYIVYSLSGFTLLIALSLLIKKVWWLERALDTIGKHTLVILLANILCRRLLEWIIAKSIAYEGNILDVFDIYPQWYVWIGCTVFMVVVPLVFITLYNELKNKLLSCSKR